jgi:hypothetical protein
MLAQILTETSAHLPTRQLAGVVLKNVLRNHLVTLNSGATQVEMCQVKDTLLQFLAKQDKLSLESKGPERKVVKEAILVLCKMAVTEFNHNADNNGLMVAVFTHFSEASYNPVFVRLVYQILKEADDDRMNLYAGGLLKACFGFITSPDPMPALARDTKLLQVIIFCFQSMQVLVATDSVKLA